MATPNLNLPQWELTDPILMEDFNNAFQSIDQFAGIIMMGDDATLLASNLGNMSGTSLSESAYNFKFLALQVTTGTFILLPILPNQTMAQGSVGVYTTEAYDTYTFTSGLYTNGTVLGDNRNLRITTRLGNPASASDTSYTITAIYGLCRRAS